VSRDYVLFLNDIEDACQKIVDYSNELTFEDFAKQDMPYYSLVRLLEVIGEAVKNLPEEVRDRYPAVQWRQIARARDLMAHHYFGLEDETLWEMVQVHVPVLLAQIRPIIDQESGAGPTER
jgi:uncharacterized protein with HEPN domain